MILGDCGRQTRVGLLLSHLDGSYQHRFWSGFAAFCREANCDLVVYASRLWRGQSDSFEEQEIVYRLANARELDALCIDTSAFQNQEDLDHFLATSPALAPIPIIFSSTGREGNLIIAPDNRGGIIQALEHLTEVHNCTRFAWVGGPPDIADAREREQAFCDFLKDHGLTRTPRWMTTAGFDSPSGRLATAHILDAGGGLPDAIIYANDHMAAGGLEVLAERGIRVPEDVLVTGFDEDDIGFLSTPVLATVSQPVEEKARLTAQLLVDAARGHVPTQPPPLEVCFLPRASCGCIDISSPRAQASRARREQDLVNANRALTAMARITEHLGSVLSLDQLCSKMSLVTPQLGIGFAGILLHDEEAGPPWPTPFSWLVCAIGPDGLPLVTSDRPRRIISSALFPAGLSRSGHFVQALYKANRHFGFLVTSIDEPLVHPAVLVSLRDHISEILFTISQVRDLTESRQALEEALSRSAQSEQKFRELVASLPSFVMETRANGSIEYLNERALRLLGLEDEWPARSISLDQIIAPGSKLPPTQQSKPDAYHPLVLRGRNGSSLQLLVRAVEVDPDRGLVTWSGFDYQSALESLVAPDPDFFDEYQLTRREREVLTLELRGLLVKEIAAELCLSPSTVKGHLGLVYRKLGVSSRDQVFRLVGTRLADRHGPDSLAFTLLAEALKD